MNFFSLFYPQIKYLITALGGAADGYLKPIVCMHK